MSKPKNRGARLLIAVGAVLATRSVVASTLAWDSAGTSASHPTDGGGNWDLSHADWSNASTDTIWPNDTSVAIFGQSRGTAATVSVAAPLNVGGIIFNNSSGNYTIAGTSAINLSGATVTIAANGSTSPTISAPVIGSSQLLVTGTGTLILSGSNTYYGGTNVSTGTLNVTGGAFYDVGGSITGTVSLSNPTAEFLYFGPSASAGTFVISGAPSNVHLIGTTSLANIPAGAAISMPSI